MSSSWEELFQQGEIRGTTCRLLDCLLLDVWPPIPVIADFGITSQDHYAALKYAIFFDDDTIEGSCDEEKFEQRAEDEFRRRICELDRALQHGQRLTAFVQKYAPGRLSQIVFDTGMDDLAEILEQERNER